MDIITESFKIHEKIKKSLKVCSPEDKVKLNCSANGLPHLELIVLSLVTDRVFDPFWDHIDTLGVIDLADFNEMYHAFEPKLTEYVHYFIKLHCDRQEILEKL